MNLTIRQLATFREVMRTGSISHAARIVGRTQPAVSSTIASLEKEVGFKLFVRKNSKLTPTPEGHYFLEEAEAILNRIDRTEQTIKKIQQMEEGKLKIACHPAASNLFMPKLLTKFLDNKKYLEIALNMRSSDVIADLVASQQYDIGFAETPQARMSILQRDYDLECVCILRKDDPVASLPVITPNELDGKPMAVLFEGHTTAIQTEMAFQADRKKFNKRFELRTFYPGLQFVEAGACYMICDLITAYSYIRYESEPQSLTIRRFAPRVNNMLSILTPAFATQSLVAQEFERAIIGAIKAVQNEILAMLDAPYEPHRGPMDLKLPPN